MIDLWKKDTELSFFSEARKFATAEQLFYLSNDKKYYAYWPKKYSGTKNTLQSRNALIGKFTEKWSRDIIEHYAKKKGLHAVQGAICDEIGLPNNSNADVAICKTKDLIQKPENIVVLFEVKMSVVWNWQYILEKGKETIKCIGDFTTHQGNPGLLRSDSMLKAIGKSINIRVSAFASSHIPIIILGNTPITKNYINKVDHLKTAGIIQGFWSLNPSPTKDDKLNLKNTKENGFIRFDTYADFEKMLENVISIKRSFFSSMKSNKELGKIIEIANKEESYERKAEKFLALLKDGVK